MSRGESEGKRTDEAEEGTEWLWVYRVMRLSAESLLLSLPTAAALLVNKF
jgi:hypothetical protein